MLVDVGFSGSGGLCCVVLLIMVIDKSNEVKTGGAVPSKGRTITLKVEDEEDLARDILKVGSILFYKITLNII